MTRSNQYAKFLAISCTAAAFAGCSSSKTSAASTTTNDAAISSDNDAAVGSDGAVATCAAGSFATLPRYYAVDGLSGMPWDETGIVLHALVDPTQSSNALQVPDTIVGIPVTLNGGAPVAGTSTTLYTAPTNSTIGTVLATPTTIYFSIVIALTGTGIYSMPRGGGAATALFTAKDGESIDALVLGADGLYFTEKNDFAFPAEVYNIESIPLTPGGTATVVYTAPSGQLIDNLVGSPTLAGETSSALFWSETADVGQAATVTTIRSAPTSSTTATPLVAAAFGTAPIGTDVSALVASGGATDTVYFSAESIGITTGGSATVLSGLYSLALNGSPVSIDPNASLPLIGFSEASSLTLLFNAPPGIRAYPDPSGPETTVLSNGVGVDAITANDDFQGSDTPELVYATGGCLYALSTF